MNMGKSWIPRILRPDFTWPRPMQSTISVTTPPIPRVPSLISRRMWGIVHKALFHLSEHYCSWFDIPINAQILELPFGLVMKWTDRTSLEEVIAMQMVRQAGIPAPKVLCCGEHRSFRQISILMTRLPGITLENSFNALNADEEEPWLNELKICLDSIRQWKGPEKGICSAIGTSIRSIRVPNQIMGPFENEADLHKFLLYPASKHNFALTEEYEETLLLAKRIQQQPHRITFTQGDFKAHNILVSDDGHLSGFLDWESAGWCPEYWEFATAMRFGKAGWWYQVAAWMGGDQYLEELESDVALNRVTSGSYIGM